jgi:hypothetical protein
MPYYMETAPSAVSEVAKNEHITSNIIIAMDFAGALSPVLAQAG